MERVLITGGAGFIGTSLVRALMLSKNYHVTVLDNLSRGSKKNISRWLGSLNFEFVRPTYLTILVLLTNWILHHYKLQWIILILFFIWLQTPDVVIGAENTRIDFQQNVQAYLYFTGSDSQKSSSP